VGARLERRVRRNEQKGFYASENSFRRAPVLENIDRFALMPTICADGTACTLLCIFKGSSLRYRVIALPTGGVVDWVVCGQVYN
jgi:hypothetical protein